MTRTRTPGIRIDRDGRRIIDKEHRGAGIYLRLGPISQKHAEQRLAEEIARINSELQRNANPVVSKISVKVLTLPLGNNS